MGTGTTPHFGQEMGATCFAIRRGLIWGIFGVFLNLKICKIDDFFSRHRSFIALLNSISLRGLCGYEISILRLSSRSLKNGEIMKPIGHRPGGAVEARETRIYGKRVKPHSSNLAQAPNLIGTFLRSSIIQKSNQLLSVLVHTGAVLYSGGQLWAGAPEGSSVTSVMILSHSPRCCSVSNASDLGLVHKVRHL